MYESATAAAVVWIEDRGDIGGAGTQFVRLTVLSSPV